MSLQTFANTNNQWTSTGYLGFPVAYPYYHSIHPIPKTYAMGRKKGASYTPNYAAEWTPPPVVSLQHDPQERRPWQNSAQPPNVSQKSIYSIVDSWRAYKPDTAAYQHEYEQNSNYAAQVPNTYQHAQLPQYQSTYWTPQTLRTAAQPLPQPTALQPQANAFRPGQRLVNGYLPHSSYRVDKSSRYNLRARPFSTVAADQVIQSIETDDFAQLPLRTEQSQRSQRRSTPRRGPTPINDQVTPPVPPPTSSKYLEAAQAAPQSLLQPRKLLVLLDLNGTLVYRAGFMRKTIVKRPGVDRLISYLFANHHVMLFTSATMSSAQRMAKELFTPQQNGELLAIRSREHLNLTQEQFANKVQVYKDLNTIWEDEEIKKAAAKLGVKWDMTNTVLIDDSIVKAKSHPHNLLQVSEFTEPSPSLRKSDRAAADMKQVAAMRCVERSLEDLKWQLNVACRIREWQDTKAAQSVTPGPDNMSQEDGAASTAEAANTSNLKRNTRRKNVYPTPDSVGSREGTAEVEEAEEEEEDEYDPDQWQGAKLPTPAEEEVPEQEAKKPQYEELARAGKPLGAGRGVRSPSPITEEHFAFLNLGEEGTGKSGGGKGRA